MVRPVKSLLRIALWTGLAVVLLIGLTEAALWLLAPVGKRVSHRFEFDNQLPGLKERVSFSMDGRSLRSWHSEAATGRDLHIVVLGGGATLAVLQNDEDTWWGQLGAALQQEFPQSRVRISALFRDQTTILHGAKWAQENLADLKPDIVLAAYGFEDVIGQPGTYTYRADALSHLSLEANPRGPVKEFLVTTSQLCRRAVNQRQKRGLNATLGPLGERNAFAQRLLQQRRLYASLPLKYEIKRPEGADPLAEYLDGVKSLAASAAQNGATFAVIGEPSLHRGLMEGGAENYLHRWFVIDPAQGNAGVARLDSGWIELQLSRYFGEAEKFCTTQGIAFVDPTRKLPAHPALFVDDTMLTDDGAATFAKVVLPTVKPLVAARLR